MPLPPPVNSTNSKLPVDFSLTLITSSDCSTDGEGGVDVAAATSHHQTATWTRLCRCLTRRKDFIYIHRMDQLTSLLSKLFLSKISQTNSSSAYGVKGFLCFLFLLVSLFEK
ncbi:hypothetical protein M5689_025116 [Euphorbia peplus]|nr:hypothetical protein M5689_025116 [Euphorbia peplus]